MQRHRSAPRTDHDPGPLPSTLNLPAGCAARTLPPRAAAAAARWPPARPACASPAPTKASATRATRRGWVPRPPRSSAARPASQCSALAAGLPSTPLPHSAPYWPTRKPLAAGQLSCPAATSRSASPLASCHIALQFCPAPAGHLMYPSPPCDALCTPSVPFLPHGRRPATALAAARQVLTALPIPSFIAHLCSTAASHTAFVPPLN